MLPLLVPLILSPLFFYLNHLSEFAATALMIFLYSGYIGGIPYIVLAAGMLWWMRGKDDEACRVILIASPLVMVVVLMFFSMILMAFTAQSFNHWLSGNSFVLLIFGGFSLLFGYSYVGIAILLGYLFGDKEIQ